MTLWFYSVEDFIDLFASANKLFTSCFHVFTFQARLG